MAIEAISGGVSGMNPSAALNSQTSSIAQASPGHVGSMQAATNYPAEASPHSEAADAFRETLGKLHDELSKFNADSGGKLASLDPVEAAKADMLPSPWKSSLANAAGAAPSSAVATPDATTASAGPVASPDGNNVLRKSFDHAIYVTLVSQVVTGLSQTTSTLIRQQ